MGLIGQQTPTFEWCPQAPYSAGQDVVKLAKTAGVVADKWQSYVLDGALGENYDGNWACNEVCIIVGRQNGKGGVIEMRELAGIFLFGETLILHSAHQQRTSNDAFLRMTRLVQSVPELDKCVRAIARSKGEESITFHLDDHPGTCVGKKCTIESKIRYMARTGGAGRGFTKADLIVLDEAMILDTAPIAALLPTMATQPNWQVWYMASQGDRKLPTESRVLGSVRKRGFRKEPGLYFAEWAAHLRHDKNCPRDDSGGYDCQLDVRGDPRTWAKTNPAMGIRIPESFLRKMIVGGGMSTWDADREFLGVGEYPADEGWSVISESTWRALEDKSSTRQGQPFAVGVDVAWDRSRASVSIAAKRLDGLWHWETIATRDGTAWTNDVPRLLSALGMKKPVTYVVDAKCPIIDDIKKAVGESNVYSPQATEYKAWCAKMLQILVETQDARHIGQPSLTNSLEKIDRKFYPDGGFVWQREQPKGDPTQWIALTLAVGGILRKGSKTKSRPLIAAA